MASNAPKGSGRNDPLPVFCFKVRFTSGVASGSEAFFKSVGGLKYEIETVPVKEGGMNATTWQLVGSTKWSNIVLRRGFTKDSALLTWRNSWLTTPGSRATGTIELLDTALAKQASWTFHNGIPVKWEISEFDASKSEIAIETLEIAHEGITYG